MIDNKIRSFDSRNMMECQNEQNGRNKKKLLKY